MPQSLALWLRLRCSPISSGRHQEGSYSPEFRERSCRAATRGCPANALHRERRLRAAILWLLVKRNVDDLPGLARFFDLEDQRLP